MPLPSQQCPTKSLRMPALLLATVALTLLTASCGGDNDNTTNEAAPAESMADSEGGGSEAGDGEAASGSTDLGDFPIPAPPGGAVNSVQTATTRLVSYPASELNNIVAFYEEWIAGGTWSPPQGVESNVVVLDTGQITATAFLSETQIYSIIGTPDGDRIDLALAVQG
ncbi:MAG: hypothetical protein OEV40_13530 [Acidimicrobiia bacterium]|nr:hypothetical protein [Acidimicrobiia bacterium]